MKHAKSPANGRVYDEKTHQWRDAGEAPAKAARRARTTPDPKTDAAPAAEDGAATGTAETHQSAEE
ncbi:MAG: hypothetical protein IPG66_05910 [Hydrogenophilales bacterium]|nr:hypothetical protein [Hydrogenophilales bacterium]